VPTASPGLETAKAASRPGTDIDHGRAPSRLPTEEAPCSFPDESSFLYRGSLLHPHRRGITDEPEAPQPTLGTQTCSDVAGRVSAFAASLDRIGVGRR
jgi:hypothetical protein